ncbi:MAG TPA: hypothetical protein V6C84_21930 [Coleofasciculaceae cyanobacterium]|jgi:predicted enzyme related to lactoylglutathione lyase
MALQCSTVFVALADPDGKTLVRFYRQLFAQEPVWLVPEVYAEFQLPGLRLGIFKPSMIHRSEFEGQAGSISLCLEVEQLEEAIAAVEQAFTETRLTGEHLFPGDILTSAHGREVYAYDPAGNRLILHEASLPKLKQCQLNPAEIELSEAKMPVELPEAEIPKAETPEAEMHKIKVHAAHSKEISAKQKRKNSSKLK